MFIILTVYLAVLCTVPPLSAKLIAFKDIKAQYYPSEKAMQWVRDNVKDGEKIMTLRFKPDLFYRDKYRIDKDKIISHWYHLSEFQTPQQLNAYIRANKISYILFPYGEKFQDSAENIAVRNYLKENKNKIFAEAAVFNLGNNYLYIYKLANEQD